MLVGLTPCHGFSKVPGHTGGFYHLVCRHGVSVHSGVSLKAVIVVLHVIIDVELFSMRILFPLKAGIDVTAIYTWSFSICFIAVYCCLQVFNSYRVSAWCCGLVHITEVSASGFYLRFSVWFCAPSWMSRPSVLWFLMGRKFWMFWKT